MLIEMIMEDGTNLKQASPIRLNTFATTNPEIIDSMIFWIKRIFFKSLVCQNYRQHLNSEFRIIHLNQKIKLLWHINFLEY
jgi:hypothetical protein